MIAESQALERARAIVEENLDLPVAYSAALDHRTDGELAIGDLRFIVEVKRDGRSASVARAIEQLRRYGAHCPKRKLLLIVPHMNDEGARLCVRAGVDWIDLDGNISIRDRRLRVLIRGMRNAGAHGLHLAGVNPFSRRASQVVLVLLSDPYRIWGRAEIQHLSQLDKGFVSKVLAELTRGNYVEDIPGLGRMRNVRVRDPMILLDAWAEHYEAPKPALWGLVASRDGFDTSSKINDAFRIAYHYALTGLPAAAVYSHFGSYRRVDVYLSESPSDNVRQLLRLTPEERGRNVALTIDPLRATLGVRDFDGLRYASPVVVYLDLAHLPERSKEARDEMRAYLEKQWQQ